VYYFWHQGVRIWLVDTPGFDDTDRSDSDILKDVAFWLASVYTKEARLAGIIYLHRISDVRLGGQALKNLRMFKQLCGSNNLNSVILATTHWSDAEGARISERVGREREIELMGTEGFWGGMIEKGSVVMRHDGSTESAMDIVLKIVKRKLRVVLDIQTQLVDEKRSLDDTDAAQALQAEIIRERKLFQEKLDQVQSDMKSALKEKDEEWQKQLEKDKKLYEDKIKKTHADTAALKTNLEKIVKEKEAQFKKLEADMKAQQRNYENQISQQQSSIQDLHRKHEARERAHSESINNLRLEQANQMRDMERQIREANDETSRQQLREQQEAYDRMHERQTEEQNRRWEREQEAFQRLEAQRAREQAETQRKLDALERQSRKSKAFFSDVVRGIGTALGLVLEIARLVKLG
jgi:chromosome segregation ATPase